MKHSQKAVWVIVGPNGAGKSTFVNKPPNDLQEIHHIPYLNPDPILNRHMRIFGMARWLEAFSKTSDEMDRFVWDHLHRSQSFAVEKVTPTLGFVGASFHDLQKQGWSIATIAIGLDNPDISRQRVSQRVSKGGHPVMMSDLNSVFTKHVSLMPELIALSDFARVYDNSGSDYTLLAEKRERDRPLRNRDIVASDAARRSSYLNQIMQGPR